VVGSRCTPLLASAAASHAATARDWQAQQAGRRLSVGLDAGPAAGRGPGRGGEDSKHCGLRGENLRARRREATAATMAPPRETVRAGSRRAVADPVDPVVSRRPSSRARATLWTVAVSRGSRPRAAGSRERPSDRARTDRSARRADEPGATDCCYAPSREPRVRIIATAIGPLATAGGRVAPTRGAPCGGGRGGEPWPGCRSSPSSTSGVSDCGWYR